MPAKTVKKQGGKKNRKYGRAARKSKGRDSLISAYVRNRVNAEEYFRLTGQK